ncbi:MAG: group II intron reverse transcriptase/maturase [Symploca sp. SIO3E6]|nr:group II intron reverse transcriptase/maturase [Caldora sp. SIO3E6]
MLYATWNDVNWKITREHVFGIQQRIYKASVKEEWTTVANLQKLIINSWQAKLLAVRMVTQDNQGRKTAGIDGKASLNTRERMELVNRISIDGKANPVRRIEIPKPGKKEKRPLGIPTIEDRAKQALVKMALEPEWEAKFEPNSYGFRPGKSAHDAIEGIRSRLRFEPKFVLDADIAQCFDRINHDRLMSKIKAPANIKRQIREWLKAGIFLDGAFHPTKEGTPQGGVISPLLANVALHGMEKAISSIPKKSREVLVLIRYADDLVVIGQDMEKVKQAKNILTEFLGEMGLALSEDKTRLCHTKEKLRNEEPGFDFLGMNFRQYIRGKHRSARHCSGKVYGHRLLIQPSKKSVKRFKEKIKLELTKAKRKVQGKRVLSVIASLKPIIKGWANYYRIGNKSGDIFQKLDEFIYHNLLSMTKRDMGRSSMNTMWNRYWKYTNKGWRFGDTTLMGS